VYEDDHWRRGIAPLLHVERRRWCVRTAWRGIGSGGLVLGHHHLPGLRGRSGERPAQRSWPV